MVKISSKIIKLEEKDSYIIEQFKDTNKLENSFFYDVYISVFKSMGKIINDNPDDNNDRIHNIISIIGDRGKGKTSALHTIKYILENKDIIKNNKDIDDSLKKKNFKFTDPIDPSLIAYNDSIVQIIISGLLKDIKENVEKNCNFIEDPENTIREFNKQLTKIFAILRTINCKNICEDYEEESAAEALLNIASAFELKKEIESLIDKYLKIAKCNYLVITIDDMDMNVKHSYKMIEEIRKYLQVKNTIILMGLKIEQLTDAVKIKFNKDFRSLKDIENENLLKEKIINASEKYIEKLLPASKRVYLPDISIVNPLLKTNYENNSNQNVIDEFFNIIYRKTGIILIKPQYGIHPLFPRSIREYKNFYFFMNKMKNVTNNKNKIRIRQLELFKDYILNNYVEKYFETQDKNFLKNFSNESSIQKVNKMTIQYLYNKISNKIKDIKKTYENKEPENLIEKKLKEFENLSSPINSANNITLGDVLFYIEIIEQIETDIKIFNFTSVIKLLYSIELNKSFYTYKLIATEQLGSEVKNNKINNHSRNKYLIKMEKIINGSFRGKLIEYEIQGIQSETISRIKFNTQNFQSIKIYNFPNDNITFESLFEKIENEFKNNSLDKSIKKQKIFYDDILSFLYVNLFFRYNKDPDYEYQKKYNFYYRKYSKGKTKNIVFDILNFFVYIIDKKYLFDRLFSVNKTCKIVEIDELYKENEKILTISLNMEPFLGLVKEIEQSKYDKIESYYKNVFKDILNTIDFYIKNLDVYIPDIYNEFINTYFYSYLKYDSEYSLFQYMLDTFYFASTSKYKLLKKLSDDPNIIEKIINIFETEKATLTNNINKGIQFSSLKNRSKTNNFEKKIKKSIKSEDENDSIFNLIKEEIGSDLMKIDKYLSGLSELGSKDTVSKEVLTKLMQMNNDIITKLKGLKNSNSSIKKIKWNKKEAENYIQKEKSFIRSDNKHSMFIKKDNILLTNRCFHIIKNLENIVTAIVIDKKKKLNWSKEKGKIEKKIGKSNTVEEILSFLDYTVKNL